MQMALWNWVTDGFNRAPYAVAAVRQFMVVTKIASVVLLYLLALRLRMTRVAAAGAVLLFALSPLAVYFTRTALLDNIVTPWLLAAFYLAASPRRSLGAMAGSATCFALAVLSKETALLFLPALGLLLWQCSDHRNRRFGLTIFSAALFLLLLLYPTYALIKDELLPGPGHVSLEWAVRWQLFGRRGSGSIFNPHSTAHAVTTSWLSQDPWLPRVALAAIVPGLVFRRTRAVTLAFTIQVAELLRSGYLPYPFVVAMIPFGALTVAGVLDVVWQSTKNRWPAWCTRTRVGAWLTADRPNSRSVLRRARVHRRRGPMWCRLRRIGDWTLRAVVVAAIASFVAVAWTPWRAGLSDLAHNDRDAGAARALSWMETHANHRQRLVVDDAFWVDLVRHGYPRDRVIWFTKLDVDPSITLPGAHPWRSISYIMLDYEDAMSVHLTADAAPSPDTRAQYPTLARALTAARRVETFGVGQDQVYVWRVDPNSRIKS
jgi:hypothetical protein